MAVNVDLRNVNLMRGFQGVPQIYEYLEL